MREVQLRHLTIYVYMIEISITRIGGNMSIRIFIL